MIKLKVFDTDPDKESWRVEDFFDFDTRKEFLSITPKADRSLGPLHLNWLLAKYLCECNRREGKSEEYAWETLPDGVVTATMLALSGGHVGSIKLNRHPRCQWWKDPRYCDSDVVNKFGIPFTYRPTTRSLYVRKGSVEKLVAWIGHSKTQFADFKSLEFCGEPKADDALHERIEMLMALERLKGVSFDPRKELHVIACVINQAMVGLTIT